MSCQSSSINSCISFLCKLNNSRSVFSLIKGNKSLSFVHPLFFTLCDWFLIDYCSITWIYQVLQWLPLGTSYCHIMPWKKHALSSSFFQVKRPQKNNKMRESFNSLIFFLKNKINVSYQVRLIFWYKSSEIFSFNMKENRTNLEPGTK